METCSSVVAMPMEASGSPSSSGHNQGHQALSCRHHDCFNHRGVQYKYCRHTRVDTLSPLLLPRVRVERDSSEKQSCEKRLVFDCDERPSRPTNSEAGAPLLGASMAAASSGWAEALGAASTQDLGARLAPRPPPCCRPAVNVPRSHGFRWHAG